MSVDPLATAASRAARAVAAHARGSVAMHGQQTELAIVRTVEPLSAELLEGRLTLTEDVLLLGYSARKYDEDFGLAVEDNLVLVELKSHDYLVLDVVGAKEVRKGVATDSTSGSTKALSGTVTSGAGSGGAVSVSMVVTKWKQNYDDLGVADGWVPVFASKT